MRSNNLVDLPKFRYATCSTCTFSCTAVLVQLYAYLYSCSYLSEQLYHQTYVDLLIRQNFFFHAVCAHSVPSLVPSLCTHMFAFPTQKSNPTPYFAHFLKEILRNRAHSREGNIKGNSLGGGHFDSAQSRKSPKIVS